MDSRLRDGSRQGNEVEQCSRSQVPRMSWKASSIRSRVCVAGKEDVRSRDPAYVSLKCEELVEWSWVKVGIEAIGADACQAGISVVARGSKSQSGNANANLVMARKESGMRRKEKSLRWRTERDREREKRSGGRCRERRWEMRGRRDAWKRERLQFGGGGGGDDDDDGGDLVEAARTRR